MSAKTRPTKSDQIARLTSLSQGAVALISAGNRSDAQTDLIVQALQLYKENRLIAVVGTPGPGNRATKQQALQYFSLRIENLALSPETKKHFRSYGIVYVGEFFRVKYDRKFAARSEFEAFIASLGLELHINPIEMGWVPPYWVDQSPFNLSIEKTLKPVGLDGGSRASTRTYEERHRCGQHYFGHVTQPWSEISSSGLKGRQKMLISGSGVHAAMVRPPDWTAPIEIPKEWQSMHKQIERRRLSQFPTLADAIRELGEAEAFEGFLDMLSSFERSKFYERGMWTRIRARDFRSLVRELTAKHDDKEHTGPPAQARRFERHLLAIGLQLHMSDEVLDQILGNG